MANRSSGRSRAPPATGGARTAGTMLASHGRSDGVRDRSGRAERSVERGVHVALSLPAARAVVLPAQQRRQRRRCSCSATAMRIICTTAWSRSFPPTRCWRSARACRRSGWLSVSALTQRAPASTIASRRRATTSGTRSSTRAPLRWVVVSAMWRTFDAAGHEIDFWSGQARVDVRTGRRIAARRLRRRARATDRQARRRSGDDRSRFTAARPRGRAAARAASAAGAPRRGGWREHPNVRVFDPMAILCTGPWCLVERAARRQPLSRSGSVAVARAMAQQAAAFKAP